MNVINNTKDRQFELHTENGVARITYGIEGRKIYLISTSVPEALSGKGIGSGLLRGSLDIIEEMGLKVVPVCPFAKGWFLKHPEKMELLAN